MLIISYSTEALKPSIFGAKNPLNGFRAGRFLVVVRILRDKILKRNGCKNMKPRDLSTIDNGIDNQRFK